MVNLIQTGQKGRFCEAESAMGVTQLSEERLAEHSSFRQWPSRALQCWVAAGNPTEPTGSTLGFPT